MEAIKSPTHSASGTRKIADYAHEAEAGSLKVRPMVLDTKTGHMSVNGKPTHVVSEQLKMGYTTALKDVYDIDNVPKTLEHRSVEDVKFHPSYSVGENMRFKDEKFQPQMEPKLNKEGKKVMKSTDLTEEITPRVVEQNPPLKNIFMNLSGKTMRSVGGTLLKFGIGIAAVCVVVNEHRNRLTACMLYYHEKKQLRRCTIASCTCKSVECKKDCDYCTDVIMKKYLPNDMLSTDNCIGFKGTGCAQCPSEAFSKANIEDDETLQKEDPDEAVFVRCQKPDFFEALGDIFGGTSEQLLEIVNGSLAAINWLIAKLPYIILFGIIVVVIIILISILGKFKSSSPQYTVLAPDI